jgi:hypothetical protein
VPGLFLLANHAQTKDIHAERKRDSSGATTGTGSLRTITVDCDAGFKGAFASGKWSSCNAADRLRESAFRYRVSLQIIDIQAGNAPENFRISCKTRWNFRHLLPLNFSFSGSPSCKSLNFHEPKFHISRTPTVSVACAKDEGSALKFESSYLSLCCRYGRWAGLLSATYGHAN